MNKDFPASEYSKAIPTINDSLIALDFLIALKTWVRSCAAAITEAITPEVRKVIHNHLENAIMFHGELVRLMVSKGWLHPYNLHEQFELDLQSAQVTLAKAVYPSFQEPSDCTDGQSE